MECSSFCGCDLQGGFRDLWREVALQTLASSLQLRMGCSSRSDSHLCHELSLLKGGLQAVVR